jgi:hypothetical protein
MGQFIYLKEANTVDHDFQNLNGLTPEEAQVIATQEVADNLERIASGLEELIRVLRDYPLDINIKDMP